MESQIVILILGLNQNKNYQNLNNIQRLNVALSRARSKLIIIGNKEKLTDIDVF